MKTTYEDIHFGEMEGSWGCMARGSNVLIGTVVHDEAAGWVYHQLQGHRRATLLDIADFIGQLEE